MLDYAYNRSGRTSVRLILFAIAFLSFSNFNTNLLPGHADGSAETGPYQQIIILGLWLAILGVSLLPGILRSVPPTSGLGLPLIFLLYIAASPLWSEDPLHAAPKAIAFTVISLIVWRLTAIITMTDFLNACYRALWALAVGSLIMIVLNPAAAISHDWQHPGDWQGLFQQKQNLGVVMAFFVCFCVIRFLHRRGKLEIIGILLGILLLLKSGSRGAAVIAVAGPIAIVSASRFPSLFRLIALVMGGEILLAAMQVGYFAITGNDYINIAGFELDFTDRSFIWNYGISHWLSHPLLGYGISGFWTNPDIAWGFKRVHGWVLDNFHSGYITLVVEAGLVGAGIYILILGKICATLQRLTDTRSEVSEIMLGLVLMLLTIDLTETVFLRSTNFGQIILTFFAVKLLSSPAPVRHPAIRASLPRSAVS